jgi:signal transduction histidine kinase/ActR/RegA family two-component response regulator
MFVSIFFPSIEEDRFPDLEHHQKRIFRFFIISVSLASFFGIFLSMLWPSNFTAFSIEIFVFSLVIFWLHKRYYPFTVRFGLLILNFLIMYQSYISQSAYTATLLGLTLIIASILLKNKELFIFLFLDSIYILYMLIIGSFTLSNLVVVDGVALVNNATVLIPSMICSFFIGMIISKVLISTIREQQDQYEKLQKTRNMLIHQEKIESIRMLAGGVAHDFNNILVSIMGNISILSLKENENKEDSEILKEMLYASKRARNLTEQLLLYTKNTQFQSEIISNVDFLVQEIANFSLRGRKSKVKYQISENLGTIFGDRMKLSQVIQNLVINADEAYESSGIIEISIYNQTFCESDLSHSKNNDTKLDKHPLIPNIKPGAYLVIEVKDYAKGIPKDLMSKIFDPYFTTKEKGTGLGLAISLSIIQQHNGFLSLESEVGVGTTFKIFLPRVDVISSTEHQKESMVKLDLSKYSIYVIDDDNFNVNMLRRMLMECNADISSDKCGEDFIEKMKTSMIKPDIVIVDYIMPGFMNGLECIRLLKQITPTTKFILTSGYHQESIPSSLQLFDAYLKKPYTFEELISAVNNAIKR